MAESYIIISGKILSLKLDYENVLHQFFKWKNLLLIFKIKSIMTIRLDQIHD